MSNGMALELPSQFMENFFIRSHYFAKFAIHHETGEGDAGRFGR